MKHRIKSILCSCLENWMRVIVICVLVQSCSRAPAFAAGATVEAGPTISSTAVVETQIVPAQNPWNVRLGIDSIVLVPAAQARELSKALVERNGCVGMIGNYERRDVERVRLHAIDSTELHNVKTQRDLVDSLRRSQVAAASSKKWQWFGAGAATGTFVTGVVGVVLILLIGGK